VLQVLLNFREEITTFFDSAILKASLDGLYYIIPKTIELDAIGADLALGRSPESWFPLYGTLIVTVIAVYLAVMRFKSKDF
jgi:hypothetical protein